MSDLTIKCNMCKCEVLHYCTVGQEMSLRQWAIKLFKFRPEIGFPEQMKEGTEVTKIEGGGLDVDQPDVPLLSETYLYPLLGKEDARTFMSLVDWIFRSMGIDPHELHQTAYLELSTEKQERNKQETARKERSLKRKKT